MGGCCAFLTNLFRLMNQKYLCGVLAALLVSLSIAAVAAPVYTLHVPLHGLKPTSSAGAANPSGTGNSIPVPPTQAAVTLTATTSVNFGNVPVGTTATRSFTFTNSGTATVTGTYAQITGQGLTLSANTCGTQATPSSVGASTSCSLTVSYAPASAVALSNALLSVYSSAPNSPATQALAGAGVVPTFANCLAIKTANPSAANGTYSVDPDGAGAMPSMNVYCDMTTDGGGWTLVVRALTANTLHTNTAAVGALTSPTQTTSAKLSDAVINQLATGYFHLLGDDGLGYYFQTQSGTPFAAVGAAASRPMSATFGGTYVASPVNGAHGGLNAYPTATRVYGDSAEGSTCRQGFATLPTHWCGAGTSGTLWVR
jgi:hypothetical protein